MFAFFDVEEKKLKAKFGIEECHVCVDLERISLAEQNRELTIAKSRIAELEKENKELVQKIESNIVCEEKEIATEDQTLTFGPYQITNGRKRAFTSIMNVLYNLKYFEKQEDGNYASNKSDVIQSLLLGKQNVHNEVSKGLKQELYMETFHEIVEKASELYSKK